MALKRKKIINKRETDKKGNTVARWFVDFVSHGMIPNFK